MDGSIRNDLSVDHKFCSFIDIKWCIIIDKNVKKLGY